MLYDTDIPFISFKIFSEYPHYTFATSALPRNPISGSVKTYEYVTHDFSVLPTVLISCFFSWKQQKGLVHKALKKHLSYNAVFFHCFHTALLPDDRDPSASVKSSRKDHRKSRRIMYYSFFVYVMHHLPVHLSLFSEKCAIAPCWRRISRRALVLEIVFYY